ncbi:MAG TPA: YggT family protein [Pyrinomonadaceae bacterium]|jgi:YggT family protein
MTILRQIDLFLYFGVIAVTVAGVLLILLRSLFRYMDVNPFTWKAITVKRLTDPIILPVRRMLVAMRIDPIAAPVIVMVVFILIGFFVIQISSGFLNTLAGILAAVTSGKPNAAIAILGYVLYALVGLYELMIFARIVGVWFVVSYGDRRMRFLIRTTEPLLAPLRRTIPPVGMFDVSPIIAFVILWLLQAAIAATLLSGWTVRFF